MSKGKEIKLGRLLSKGKVVIVALDHGGFMGPIRGIEKLPEEIKKYKKADAILLNPGMIRHCARFFSSKDAPLAIFRLNWGSHYCKGFEKGFTKQTCSVQDAVSLGADIILASLCLQGEESAVVENIALLGKIREESENLGIPLIGEFIPKRSLNQTKKGEEALIKSGVRLCAELGCDLIKTPYINGFSDLVRLVPIPILVLGGARMEEDSEALKFASMAVEEGAKGVIFGRNVFQSPNPREFLIALIRVVKDRKSL